MARFFIMRFSHGLLLLIAVLLLSGADVYSQSESRCVATDVERFSSATNLKKFILMANNYESQSNITFCGPTSLSIVLNSVASSGDCKNNMVSFSVRYDQFSVVSSREMMRRIMCLREDASCGLTISEMNELAEQNGLLSKIYDVKSLSLDEMTSKIKHAILSDDEYIIVNYSRKKIGQSPGDGHFSPIAAFHEDTNSFLIMDVNNVHHKWIWVSNKVLYDAMNTEDSLGNRRGFVLLKPLKRHNK